MAEFSIQDAAFTGFRVVREHPWALLFWALYALALSLVFGAIFVGLMGPDLTRLTAASAQGARDPAQTLAVMGRLLPGYGLLLAVGLVFNSILGAAMIRAVLRPTDDRFGFIRLGADELRQMALAALTFLVFLGAYVALVFALVIMGVLVGIIARTAGGLVVFLGVIVGVGALAILGVRLSLAPALTFDAGRIDLFGSWSLTRGRFWPLFATYLLAFAMIAVVYLLGLLVIFALAAVLNGGNPMTSMMRPDMSSLGAYFTPARLAQTALTAGVTALVWPVALTPSAAIYRRLAPAGAAAADAFV
jgi:hypothetical protein